MILTSETLLTSVMLSPELVQYEVPTLNCLGATVLHAGADQSNGPPISSPGTDISGQTRKIIQSFRCLSPKRSWLNGRSRSCASGVQGPASEFSSACTSHYHIHGACKSNKTMLQLKGSSRQWKSNWTSRTQRTSFASERKRSKQKVREQTGGRVSGSTMEKWSKRVRVSRDETAVRWHARSISQQQHRGQRPRQRTSCIRRQTCSQATRKKTWKEVRVQSRCQGRARPHSRQLEDWHLLACRSERGKYVYVNTTDTFGVASAALLVEQSGDCCHQGCALHLGT